MEVGEFGGGEEVGWRLRCHVRRLVRSLFGWGL